MRGQSYNLHVNSSLKLFKNFCLTAGTHAMDLAEFSIFCFCCVSIVYLIAIALAFSPLRGENSSHSMMAGNKLNFSLREALSRPVGPLERGLLTEEKRCGSMITVLLRLKSKVRLDPEMVRKALMLLVERHPLLRMKIVKKSHGNGKPVKEYFTELQDLSEINFRVLKDFNVDDLEPVFERESEIPLDLKVGPLWRASLLDEHCVVGKKAFKNAIVFTFHHVITDGRSILAMLEQLLCYLTMLHEGQDVLVESMPFRPSTAHLMRHCCTPSVLDKAVFTATSILSRLRAFLFKSPKAENLYLVNYPPVFTRNSAAPNKTSVVYREVSHDETLSLIKKCKLEKCSVHGAITAATHIAMAKILENGKKKTAYDPMSIKSSCNVDLRKECRPEIESNEFVLCVSSFRTEIKVSPGIKHFWKFAKECTRQVQWAFFTSQHHKFLKQCHMKLTATEQHGAVPVSQQDLRVFNLSNMGKQEWVMEPKGPYRVAGVAGSVTVQPTGPVFALLCATINGEMYWTNSYNTRVVTREQAIEFLELTLGILNNVCVA